LVPGKAPGGPEHTLLRPSLPNLEVHMVRRIVGRLMAAALVLATGRAALAQGSSLAGKVTEAEKKARGPRSATR
jgi:hypothetical protein